MANDQLNESERAALRALAERVGLNEAARRARLAAGTFLRCAAGLRVMRGSAHLARQAIVNSAKSEPSPKAA